MKRVLHKLLAALLCVGLLSGLLTTASGSSNIYLMAVNDTVVEMTADNMPIVVGGVLYVPYTMLSSKYSGINLGVNAQYSNTRRTVLVSGGRLGVIFDPQANASYDLNQNPLSGRAVVRNGMVYLPLAWVCNYFGTITYTTTKTDFGTLVRVTNSAVILSDTEFVDAATSMLRANYNSYMESVRGNPGNPSGGGPSQSNQPENGPLVYLAFRVGEQTEEMAQLLENRIQRGLFLFTVEQMAQEDDLIRRLVGAGHMVGLELTGESAEACEAELREGAELLSNMARCALTIICARNVPEEVQGQLSEAGCALWQATAVTDGLNGVPELLRGLDSESPNYVEVNCDEAGLSLMTAAMPYLAGTSYRLRQAVAPAL